MLILIILVLLLSLVACGKVNFDDLIIIAESVTDVQAGEYTLDYTIDKLDKFSANYDLEISVKVFDDTNKAVTVLNNRTFNAENNNVYYVTVYVKTKVDGKYETKSKSYTVTTIKTDPKLILKLLILDHTYDHSVINLTYGQSYDINNLPEVPNANPQVEGYDYSIKEKHWAVKTFLGGEEALTQEHLNNITKTITIYGVYEFLSIPKICTLSFNTNGANTISPITKPYSSSVSRPDDPIREGYYFAGWYNDENLTSMFNWTNSTLMPTTRTVHAKWLKDNNSGQKDFFVYTYVSDSTTGYGYYIIAAGSQMTLPSDVVIPNGHNNKPVTIIGEYAFQNQTVLESVTIPDSIITVRPWAFSGCTALSQVVFQNNMEKFESKVFENCTSLTSLTVPDSVNNITGDAFLGCSSLTTLTFTKDSKLKTLAVNAFKDTAITELRLPFDMSKNAVSMKNKNGNTISLTYFENATPEN